MGNIITWGTLQYPETQVLEFFPVFDGERVQQFNRINNKAILYLAEVPLAIWRVKLLFSGWSEARNTANPAISKANELETRFRSGTSAALNIAGTAQGNFVIKSLGIRYEYCAETGMPYIVSCDVDWLEDVV